jgi:hypothetical protein
LTGCASKNDSIERASFTDAFFVLLTCWIFTEEQGQNLLEQAALAGWAKSCNDFSVCVKFNRNHTTIR